MSPSWIVVCDQSLAGSATGGSRKVEIRDGSGPGQASGRPGSWSVSPGTRPTGDSGPRFQSTYDSVVSTRS